MKRIVAILVLIWAWAGAAHGSGLPIVGHSQNLPAGSGTATFVIAVGEMERRAESRVVFAGLAESEGALPEIALVAAPEESWFSSGWELRLEAAPGVVAGDPEPVKLRSGLSAPFFFPGETYRAVLSLDSGTGELSLSLHNVTRNAEVYAGALFLEPEAARRLRVATAGLIGSPSGEGALEEAIQAFRIESAQVEHGFVRHGQWLPLAQVRAGVVSPETGRFVTAVGLNEGPVAIRISRPFGRLPGWFVVLVAQQDGRDATVREGAGDGRLERVLTTLPAEPLEVEASLGERELPPGRHTVRVVYQPPADAVGQFAEEEIRSMTLDVKPPQITARVRFVPPGGARFSDGTGTPAAGAGALDPAGPMRAGARLGGSVEITADQPVQWLTVSVRSEAGEAILHERLENVRPGTLVVPISFPVGEIRELLKPLILNIEWPDGAGIEEVVHPLRVALAASGDMIEETSYQQPVRRLAPPVELRLDRVAVKTNGASEIGEAAVRTYDLVELRVSTQVTDVADEIAVSVAFTSPAGEVFEAPGRRLVRPEVEGYWVARLLPFEAGRWHYRVTLAHPDWAPGGVELTAGELVVRESGRKIPTVRREWGESEPKPEGQRVAALRYRRGNTVKLEQLIGDWDSHLDIPVLNQTLSDYGLIGTDLGQPFEHNGNVVYLFGDTMGTRGFVESSLASSWTQDPEKGLALDFYTDETGYVLRIRPPGLRMAGFEVPSGGMSIDGQMYFIVKDQATEEPMGMTFRSVLIRFDEERREFVPVREFSPYGGKFAEVVARPAPEGLVGLPFDGPAMLLWGSGEYYRKGSLYLAVTRPEEIEEAERMYYFAGFDDGGMPTWAKTEAEAVPVVRHSQIGEFSVVYSEDLEIWLLAYNSGAPRGINLQWAHQPWGPWERSQVIFEPWLDGGYAQFMHALNMPDASLAGPVINPQPPAVEQWGGEYAPYMIERFLRHRDGRLTIYYLMSTWNPYVVVLMRTDLDVVFEPEPSHESIR